ncbi:immunoglobulin-like domain-containing protein [Jeotgalibacillus salarius]|uniref:Bacterial Ig-like domain-containing protein n=1 Tax=Jeotgalibacillus salarius TaxID=546023 RepID=A0A4Y8LRE7_9BACL|nr:immunoglobulin-like domain-containing protein [Jeotgalibacillus salarius]TFE04029.1 hypothetical protein E2626_01490 [Jeotgalibacillus salarius]
MKLHIIVGGFIVLLLTGCISNSDEDTDWEPTNAEEVNQLEGVSMTVKEGSGSTTGVTVLIKNDSDQEVRHGKPYVLEKKINDEWYRVPIMNGLGDFTDIGYSELPTGSVYERETIWGSGKYDPLENGEYRIVKDIMVFKQSRNYDKYDLTAEFEINE